MDDSTQAAIDVWQQDRRTRFGHLFEVDGIISFAPAPRTDGAAEPFAAAKV